MVNCSVATCKNDSRKTNGVIYHVFPKDSSLCSVWIVKTRRADAISIKNARICSDHFLEGDYQDDFQNRILGLPQKKILRPDAVPSVNIGKVSECNTNSTLRDERCNKRVVRKSAIEYLSGLSPKNARVNQNESDAGVDIVNSVNNGPNNEFTIHSNSGDFTDCLSCLDKEKEIKRLKQELQCIKHDLQAAKGKVKAQTKKLARCLRTKTKLRAVLSKKVKNNSNGKKCDKKCHLFLNNTKEIFTANQIKCIMYSKKRVKWNSNDISLGIILRALNQKTYEFLRNKMHFPLPSPSTLKRWCSTFQCYPGILSNVLKLVSKTAETMSELERICVLSFDEMHIDNKVSYHTGLDQVLGPFGKVQVVLARGLLSPWKQPVYYSFDTNMTKDIMFDVITHLERCNIKVVGIVSDLGGCSSLYKQLGIGVDKCSFTNPCAGERKIHVFADMPHYFKLMRNHFLDSGIKLEDGTELNSSVIEELMKQDQGEIKLCHKLKPEYLTVKGNARQKVAPAKALFSATVAAAISALTNNKKAADFFQLMDNFFDIMNSKSPFGSKPLNAAFGIEQVVETQKKTLMEVKKTVQSMRIMGKNGLLPFQKGILMSITSLFELHEDLKRQGMKYILTSRLTQDALENLFGQLRGLGHFNDHPTPTEVIYRLKHLLLSNKLPKPSPKSNVVYEQNTNTEIKTYLTAELLDSAFSIKEKQEENMLPSRGITKSEVSDLTEVMEEETEDNLVTDQCVPGERETSWAEDQGLNYIAGYIAFKVKHIDPTLGTITKNLQEEASYNADVSWIAAISRGWLTEPSTRWKDTIRLFEAEFVKFHGDGESLDRGRYVVSRLEDILKAKFPRECHEAIRLFAKLRTIIRIRNINRCQKDTRKSEQKMSKWLKSGYNWCVEAINNSAYAPLAGDLEINKAVTFLKQKEIPQAMETLKTFQRKESKVASTAASNLSFVHFLQGDTEQAEKYAELAKEVDGYNAAAYVNLGNCSLAKGEQQRAKQLYTLALDNDASCIEALYNLGLVNKQLGLFEESLDCFLKLHSIVSHHPQVVYQLAHLHELVGDIDQSIEWFLQLLGIIPTDSGILHKLGEVFDSENDKQQAYHYYFESFRHFPSNFTVLDWLGAYFVSLQVAEKAVVFYEKAALMQPTEPKWRLLIGSCHRRSGNYQLALRTYKEILAEFPENIECLKFLVRMCSDMGLPEATSYAMQLKKAEKAKELRERIGSSQSGSGSQRSSGRSSQGLPSPLSDSTPPGQRRGSTASRQAKLSALESPANLADSFGRSQFRDIDASYSDPLGPQERPRTAARSRSQMEDEFGDEDLADYLLPE